MSDRKSLVIIGAGPAGTAAAITAAAVGVNVTLLERSEFPRHRPGETLHPGIEPLLRQLGVWERIEQVGFVRHAGVRIRSQGREDFQPFGSDANGEWLGLQAWRAEFDQVLLQRASELGVRVLHPCSVERAIVREGVVTGVESDQGRIFADITIDAAGGRHWLANELRIPMHIESPMLVAQYGYVEGDYADAHDSPVLTTDADGWTWIARVRERTFQWTRLSLNPEMDHVAPPMKSEIPVELRLLAQVGHICGADVTWRGVSAPAGAGYFICGDAAAVLDPASSHGVLKAVMSGIYAGHLAGQILGSTKTTMDARIEYSDWLTRWFRHDVDSLKKLYEQMGWRIECSHTPT